MRHAIQPPNATKGGRGSLPPSSVEITALASASGEAEKERRLALFSLFKHPILSTHAVIGVLLDELFNRAVVVHILKRAGNLSRQSVVTLLEANGIVLAAQGVKLLIGIGA